MFYVTNYRVKKCIQYYCLIFIIFTLSPLFFFFSPYLSDAEWKIQPNWNQSINSHTQKQQKSVRKQKTAKIFFFSFIFTFALQFVTLRKKKERKTQPKWISHSQYKYLIYSPQTYFFIFFRFFCFFVFSYNLVFFLVSYNLILI